MATVREVADDLGVPSGELVRRLRAIGVDVDGDDSVVDEDAARRLAAPRDGSGPGASTAPLRVKAPPPPPPPPSRAS